MEEISHKFLTQVAKNSFLVLPYVNTSPTKKLSRFNIIHTNIFYNLFMLCGVINDIVYIFEDLPIKVIYLFC